MSLEARIPPPAVAVAAALVIWGVSRIAPLVPMPQGVRLAACAAFVVAGAGFIVAGVLSFRRAQTTLDPTRPQAASSLVITGIYRVTRNPMYLGLALLLAAWAVYLSSAFALLGVAAFVLYIDRLQIVPEERALSTVFGNAYAAYRAKVRRWL